MFDEQHDLASLMERYPDPSSLAVTGDPPLLHHGLAFGRTPVAIKAVRACLLIAKKRGDTASAAHLRTHLKEYEAWKKARDSHRAARDGVTRQRGGHVVPPPPILP